MNPAFRRTLTPAELHEVRRELMAFRLEWRSGFRWGFCAALLTVLVAAWAISFWRR